MSNKKQFVDIHCHPTMKPFYSSSKHTEKKNIWEFVEESRACKTIHDNSKGLIETTLVKQLDAMAKDSQMNLDSCQKGNLKVLFATLYPVERGWFKIRDVADVATNDEFITLSSVCSSGFNEQVVREFEKVIKDEKEINYFEELVREYHFLNSSQATSGSADKQFVLVNSYHELKTIIENPNDNRIALILNIEGGHALCTYNDFDDLKNTPFRKVNNPNNYLFDKYQKIFLHHINIIKGKESINIKVDGQAETVEFKHTPFYITFAHHFWNLLCGHADSFGFGVDLVLNQGRGKNRKFTALGKLVLRKLLFRDANERRILIDIKHLSINARKEFFNIWEQDYNSIEDSFPIICSHTAVNGRADYDDAWQDEEEPSIFNTSSINMFDVDIEMVHKSNGLIGLILSNSRLPGEETLEDIKFTQKQIIKYPDREHEFRKEISHDYMKSLTANIFHIVKIAGQKSGWDIMSIGSDFDGMIEPLIGYEKAKDYNNLSDDLGKYIHKCVGIEEMSMDAQQMKDLMYGYSAKEIVEKVMSSNALDFTRKYFHDDFLKEGIVGNI